MRRSIILERKGVCEAWGRERVALLKVKLHEIEKDAFEARLPNWS